MVGFESIDQTEMSLNPFAFPSHLAHGIVGQVGRPDDVSVLLKTQNRIGAQREGAGEIVARGHHHFAAPQNPAPVDGLLQRGGIFGDAVAFGSEVADVESEFDSSSGGFWTWERALAGLIRRSSSDHAEWDK